VPSVPSALANLWTSYDFAVPEPVGNLGALFGTRYQNREYADAGQTRIVPGAPLFQAGLEWRKERYRFTITVDNILNRTNFVYGAGTGGGAYPGPGRTVMARFTVGLH